MGGMGLWPFGRDPANVEIVSRIVTATVGDSVKVRGKLALHFDEPQTQAIADDAAERCAALMEIVLREQKNHELVLGAEAEMVLKLVDRLPPNMVATRTIELAALHVVGDPGSSARRRPSTAALQPIRPPSAPPPAMAPGSSQRPPPPPPLAGPASSLAPASSVAPGSATPSTLAPRRRSSNRIRAMTASLVIPVGSSPRAIGAAIAPLVRDTSMRLFIGFLRIHDLVAVRGVVLEEGSDDLQMAVSTILELPQGEDASRAAEIARWQQAIGADVVDELRREASAVAVYLARAAITHADVPLDVTLELLEECCSRAAPGERSPLLSIDSDLGVAPGGLPSAIAARITEIVGDVRDPASMAPALAPLVASVEEDISIAATLSRHSLGR